MMNDSMSDLLILIVTLGIVVGIGLGALLPLMDSDLMGYNENLDDKSVTQSFEDVGAAQYQGDMNILEAMLTLQVQDEKIPEPRVITKHGGASAGSEILIDGTFKNTLLADTNLLFNDVTNYYKNKNVRDIDKLHTFKPEVMKSRYAFTYYFLDTKISGTPTLEHRLELSMTRGWDNAEGEKKLYTLEAH